MEGHLAASIMGTVCLIFAIIAFSAYMRIIMYLHALDAGLENPPVRPQIGDKLRAYRDLCQDRDQKPYLLTLFGVGVIGAVLAWLPLPWLIFH
jgi:hypothetical protein